MFRLSTIVILKAVIGVFKYVIAYKIEISVLLKKLFLLLRHFFLLNRGRSTTLSLNFWLYLLLVSIGYNLIPFEGNVR